MDTNSKYMIRYYHVVQIFSVRHICSQGVNQKKIQGCTDPLSWPDTRSLGCSLFLLLSVTPYPAMKKKTPVWADCGCAWTQNRQELVFHKQYKP